MFLVLRIVKKVSDWKQMRELMLGLGWIVVAGKGREN
jgi:hypothetical protein